MFDKFCDYMYYLLTSPLKKIEKSINQWYILFKVLGKRFDDAMESIYYAREQTMVATCDPVMLPVHAADRNLTRYSGESEESFRKRISSYTEIVKLGGTDLGVLLAAKSLGYENVEIVNAKELTKDENRWAEFFVIIYMQADQVHPIGFSILVQHVRKTKEVGAKDNYLFCYQVENNNGIERAVYRCLYHHGIRMKEKQKQRIIYRIQNINRPTQKENITINHNVWRFDGTYRFDGTKKANAYIREERL